ASGPSVPGFGSLELVAQLLDAEKFDPVGAPACPMGGALRADIRDSVLDDVEPGSQLAEPFDRVANADFRVHAINHHVLIVDEQAAEEGLRVAITREDVEELLFEYDLAGVSHCGGEFGCAQLAICDEERIERRGFVDFLLSGRAVHAVIDEFAAVAL